MDNRRSDMKHLTGYSQPDPARRWKRAVVEARCAGREPVPNIGLNICTGSFIGVLFVVALFLTMEPFMLL
jgi:hypothetical protein